MKFQGWVVERVNRFSPKLPPGAIVGYLIAGGSCGGFSFQEPAFYQNLAMFNTVEVARLVMAHELYHAVQTLFRPEQHDWWREEAGLDDKEKVLAEQCRSDYYLFNALYMEGTASYVGDVALLQVAQSDEAKDLVKELENGLAQIASSVTLLELSVIGFDATPPVSFQDVYDLGFLGREIEYKLGYVMARAIVEDQGATALSGLLTKPAYAFVDRYTALPLYGKDNAHPRLGSYTLRAVDRLRHGCPRTP